MPIPGNSHSAGKKPTPPTIGSATAGNASASVAFTASTYIGKGTIAYTATSTPGAKTGSGSSPITVSSLSNGTSYTFSVAGATNYGVLSDASDFSNPVTPVAPPFFPFFPYFPPTCTAGCGSWSYTYGAWSAWSACSGGTQSRTRTVNGSRTCTNADCSTYTETSSTTETEYQSCGGFTGVVQGTCYSYAPCPSGLEREDLYYENGVLVDSQYVCCPPTSNCGLPCEFCAYDYGAGCGCSCSY